MNILASRFEANSGLSGPEIIVQRVPAIDFALVALLSRELGQETDRKTASAINLPETIEAISVIASEPFGLVLGAYMFDKLIGTLLIGGKEESEWEGGFYLQITSLFVPEQNRVKGVGRALVAAAREHARSAGALGLQLHVHAGNVRAQAFYEACGIQMTNYRLMREHFAQDHQV